MCLANSTLSFYYGVRMRTVPDMHFDYRLERLEATPSDAKRRWPLAVETTPGPIAISAEVLAPCIIRSVGRSFGRSFGRSVGRSIGRRMVRIGRPNRGLSIDRSILYS